MAELDDLLATVRCDLELEQLPALRAFDKLTEAQLQELTSARYIKSNAAGIVMCYLPVARLLPYRAELLEYLQDCNWPASSYARLVLRAMGRVLLPEIRAVFRASPPDDTWIMWIIRSVLFCWDDALHRELLDELHLIARRPDREGAAVAALVVLRRLVSQAEFREWYDYLRSRYADAPEMLADLDDEFEDLAAPDPPAESPA